ncbi:MAG: RDD family protein [Candidatus Cloacimonetes bacterium]|nr:RDD family protein [Candidatus Cloacimonadota bacterium]
MKWYYAKEDEKIGPITKDNIKVLVENDVINQDTMIWCTEWESWKSYKEAFSEIENYQEPVAPVEPEVEVVSEMCNECYNLFPENEMVQIGEKYVCAGCKTLYLQRIREGFGGGANNFAGFWIRVAAYMIDSVILTVVFLILGSIIALFTGPMITQNMVFTATYFINIGISSLLSIGYYVFFIGKFAATPGKMIVGIQVIVGDGSQVSYLRALARIFANSLNSFTFFIGYLLVVFDDKNRALHDMICNTRVVIR